MLGPPADYRPISKHDRANQQFGSNDILGVEVKPLTIITLAVRNMTSASVLL